MAREKVTIREALLNAGVKEMVERGYPSCNAENIVTDMLYKAFFKVLLEGTLGKGSQIDSEINKLLAEIG